ncbi:MAG: SMC-Scp complex subunit ScpB, partial [Planctomycetia bacterium]|nr:SMC-Scp complex subunit ScpB [Planctomycetia bacterium]
AMMGTADPYAAPPAGAAPDLVRVDASPDLDDGGDAGPDVKVNPRSILEALLFVGQADGEPLTSRRVAGLMRGVRPQEVDDLVAELQRGYVANNCPYEIVAKDAGWVMRLKPDFARFGQVLEGRARLVRLDAEALDVLAVVAWNEPVARDRLVELGCDASPSTLRMLVRRGLLELVPAAEPAGEPAYRTTPKFLGVFRLSSLADLPDPLAPPA